MPPEGRRYDADVLLSGRTVDEADYRNAVFEGRVDFSDCVFTSRADFSGAVFRREVHFRRVVFEEGATFKRAAFEAFANFKGARFDAEAGFRGARFTEGSFENVTVAGPLEFNWAHFHDTSLVGPLAAEVLDLRLTVFNRRVRVEVTAGSVRAERSRFPGGVRLLVGGAGPEPAGGALRWPEPLRGPAVDLTDVEFGAASLVGALDSDDREHWPRIVSLGGTDVAPLTVSYVRLAECRLAGVHNLDKLAIEGYSTFEVAPPRWWISRRYITRDEQLLRATWARRGRRHWALPGGTSVHNPASASEVEQVYRALRRGRADAKDEIGAADFYYGEMEMRRYGQYLLAGSRRRDRWWAGWVATRGEHLLLWLYWAVSGYGLRAWRAFAALVMVVGVTAAAFLAWGFRPGAGMDYADSVRFSLRAATSILRGPELKLTPAGEWIELVLRFAGPVLFGLAIFALRGRVRR